MKKTVKNAKEPRKTEKTTAERFLSLFGMLLLVLCSPLLSSYGTAAPNVGSGIKTGTAAVSVEVFSLGSGYVTQPVLVDIYEGENAAQVFLRLIYSEGLTCFYGGSPEKDFYLSYIGAGNKTTSYSGYSCSYSLFGAPREAKKLDIKPSINDSLKAYLAVQMNYFDENDASYLSDGLLGEFMFSSGAGWMYSVNGSFLNVSMSDYTLQNNDVLRVQFTLSFGEEIGGSEQVLSGAKSEFTPADKEKLTFLVARVNSGSYGEVPESCHVFAAALKTLGDINATEGEVNGAYYALSAYVEELNKPIAAQPETEPEHTQPQTEKSEETSAHDTMATDNDETDMSEHNESTTQEASTEGDRCYSGGQYSGNMLSAQEKGITKPYFTGVFTQEVNIDSQAEKRKTALAIVILAGAAAEVLFAVYNKNNQSEEL